MSGDCGELMVRVLIYLSAWFAVIPFATGCRARISDRPVGEPVTIQHPLGLPPVAIPANNPPTAATIALGRVLFYDPRVSLDGTIACSSCHDPRRYFTDHTAVSIGVGGLKGTRNAPTVLNAAYLPFQFWDGRAISLEQQAGSPIINPVEMRQKDGTAVVSKLKADSRYHTMFQNAFGSPDITMGRVENSLASFERTLLSGNAPFDRYEYSGDKAALTESQIRGLAVFLDPQRGNCAVCHTINKEFALFTDGQFHNTGEGVGDSGEFGDVGRYHETKVTTDLGAFLTPSLRNVANTAPYMHDGHLKSLKEVVDFYTGQGNSNPYLDPEMKKIHLTGREREDLVAFLQSLTGTIPPDAGPPRETSFR